MDAEGFFWRLYQHWSLVGECPKGISLENIARMNRSIYQASLKDN